MSKVLVIGSNSFSGAHFIKTLQQEGYDITGVSRSPEVKGIYKPYNDPIDFRQLDINHHNDELVHLINSEEFPYIVNFASQSMVGQSWTNPEHWYQTNAVGTVRLLDRIKEADFIRNYVHISTPEVYGSCSGRVKEDAPYNPSTPYAGSRAACDTFIHMLVKQYNFPATFTRAANVYGPGQQLFKIIPRAAIYLKKDMKIPMHGGGYAERSFIHIDDVSRGTLEVMNYATDGEIFHLSTDRQISIRDLVKRICDYAGKDFESSVDGAHERRGLDQAYILDSTRAKLAFRWEPKISLEQGLEETLNWIDKNWDDIKNEPLEYIHKP